jgi:hypothetical protein
MKANATIDAGDTVVFDISQSQIAGNKVSFPVYIVSDDTINALDFSLVYDEMNFSLDTILNLTTYLQPVYNYNLGTLYFTSYSLQQIDHNANLVSIKMNMLGHYLCSDDLSSLLVYLNGDACSVRVIECLTDAVAEHVNKSFQVFPNPATDKLNIVCDFNSEVQLKDIKGSVVFSKVNDHSDAMHVDVSQLPQGVYVLSVRQNEKVSYQKVLIN